MFSELKHNLTFICALVPLNRFKEVASPSYKDISKAWKAFWWSEIKIYKCLRIIFAVGRDRRFQKEWKRAG